jgi:hypothetical protein
MGFFGTSKDQTAAHLASYAGQPRWEYALVAKGMGTIDEEALTAYGAAGWELVAYNISEKHNVPNWIFKRPAAAA